MNNAALAGMVLLNAITALDFLMKKNYGMTVVFASYAVACAGFIVANWRST